MVTVNLRGVHVVRQRLADGTSATYHYAWRGKGAARLPGAPGSPEFVRAYQEAHAARKQPKTGTLREIVCAFRASPEFTQLSEHTKRAYRRYLDQIEFRFAELPIKALDDRGIRRHFLAWRDTMAATPRTADYAVSTLARLLAFAKDRAFIDENHAEDIGRLHSVDRSEDIWTVADFAAFDAHASAELRWAVHLAAYTGIRQSDLIRLAWGNYDGSMFQTRTSKRGKHIFVPATPECQALMVDIPRRQLTVLTTAKTRRPWTAAGLRTSFRKACAVAGVRRTFHDLRRTAATNLLILGVDAPQVAIIMGWSERSIEALKRRYVSRSAVVTAALATIAKGA